MDGEMKLEEAVDVLKTLFQQRFPEVDLEGARLQLQLQCYQNSFVLPVSTLIPYALTTFRKAITAVQGHVKDLFHAGDLANEGFLSYFQFDLMCRHLAPASYDLNIVKRLYETAADLIIQSEEEQFVISFRKFCVLAIEYDLFSVQTQERLLGDGEVQREVEGMRERAGLLAEELKWRLREREELVGRQKPGDWVERFCWALQNDSQDRALLLAYRLLDAESRRLYIEYLPPRSLSASIEPSIIPLCEAAVSTLESMLS